MFLRNLYPPLGENTDFSIRLQHIAVDVLMDLIINQVTVKGVYMGSTNIKHDIPMYANLYLQGRFNLDDLISREINISEINGAYQELKKGAIARSVITSF